MILLICVHFTCEHISTSSKSRYVRVVLYAAQNRDVIEFRQDFLEGGFGCNVSLLMVKLTADI